MGAIRKSEDPQEPRKPKLLKRNTSEGEFIVRDLAH